MKMELFVESVRWLSGNGSSVFWLVMIVPFPGSGSVTVTAVLVVNVCRCRTGPLLSALRPSKTMTSSSDAIDDFDVDRGRALDSTTSLTDLVGPELMGSAAISIRLTCSVIKVCIYSNSRGDSSRCKGWSADGPTLTSG